MLKIVTAKTHGNFIKMYTHVLKCKLYFLQRQPVSLNLTAQIYAKNLLF